MSRWNSKQAEYISTPAIDAFLDDIVEVSRQNRRKVNRKRKVDFARNLALHRGLGRYERVSGVTTVGLRDLGVGCRHERRTIITNQAGEPVAWRCDSCPATGVHAQDPVRDTPAAAARGPGRATVTTRTECEWCGDDLPRVPPNASYVAWWRAKRYCSTQCYLDDLEDRRETGRPLTAPDALGRGRQLRP